jgi:hypothetical protein
MRRREFIQNKSEDQPVELIEATGGDPSTGWVARDCDANIDRRSAAGSRRSSGPG